MTRFQATDATIATLRWFFRDSHSEAEAAFMIGALDMTGDLEHAPASAFEVTAITKARNVRNSLLALDQPHADVLSWAFEVREYPARIVSLFVWPGVAVRTLAAQWALANAGCETRLRTTDGQANAGRAWPGLRPAGAKRKRGFWLTEHGEFIPAHDPETNEAWTEKRRAKVYPRAISVPERWYFPSRPVCAGRPERTGKLERRPTGDYHSRARPDRRDTAECERPLPEAMLAFLSGLKGTSDPIVALVNDEAERRVSEALRAFEGRRRGEPKRRAAA